MYASRFSILLRTIITSILLMVIGMYFLDILNGLVNIGNSIFALIVGEAPVSTEIVVSPEMKSIVSVSFMLLSIINLCVGMFKFVSTPSYPYSYSSSSSRELTRSSTSDVASRMPVESKDPEQVRVSVGVTEHYPNPHPKPERKPRLSYGKLQDIMGDVLSEYGQVSSDQTVVVTMPAINDPNVPKTAEFNNVFFEVLPLVDSINAQPRDKESSEYDEKIIKKLSETWMDALEFAKLTGLSGLTDTERRRAQSALNNVMSPTNEHEMKRNLELLESILSRVTYVNEKTGKVKHLNVQEVLGRKEFVELIENKRLAIEA